MFGQITCTAATMHNLHSFEQLLHWKVTICDSINNVQVRTLSERSGFISPARKALHFYSPFLQCFMLRNLVWIRPVLINSCILRRSKHTMRLVQFVESGRQRVGVEIKDGGDVVDVTAGEPSIPSDMKSFLAGGEDMMSKAQRY